MVKICYGVAIISQKKQKDIIVRSFVKWFDLGWVTTQRISSFVFEGGRDGEEIGVWKIIGMVSLCVRVCKLVC